MDYKELLSKCDDVTNDIYAHDYIIDYNWLKINRSAAHYIESIHLWYKDSLPKLLDSLAISNSKDTKKNSKRW